MVLPPAGLEHQPADNHRGGQNRQVQSPFGEHDARGEQEVRGGGVAPQRDQNAERHGRRPPRDQESQCQ